MPRGDGTGPAGVGPMTGRAGGFCAGYGVAGFMNPVGARGFSGYGRGGRWGRRGHFGGAGMGGWGPTPVPPAAPMSREQQLEALKGQADYLAEALEDIRNQITELQGAEKK